MIALFILCIALLIMGRDELDAGWIWGILGFLVIAFVLGFVLKIHPVALTVPVILADIVLILKVFGSDITIR